MATRLRFVGTGDGTHYIDLAKEMSAFHRRMHRQGRYYNVTGGYMVDSNAATRMDFNTAPDAWTIKNAYKRAFRLWKKNRAQVLQDAELGPVALKYSDFKVFLNPYHTVGTNDLRSVDSNDNTITTGDWDYSELRDVEDGDDFTLSLIGKHNGSKGAFFRVSVLQSWFESRPLPDISPSGDTPGVNEFDDPLVNIFNQSEDSDFVIAQVEGENDSCPYDRDNSIGSQATNAILANMQRKATAKLQVGGDGLGAIPGFGAMCGLVQVNVQGSVGDWEIVLDVETGGKILE
jgi:hypothetical protein